MNVLLLGSSGNLGTVIYNKLNNHKKYNVIGISRSKANIKKDLTNLNNCIKIIEKNNPKYIINCAGIINI